MAKTNKAMRAASGLLVLTLLSTCMISGTYAKYTTNGSGSDTANVAKFGVKVTSNDSMFKTNYDNTVITKGSTNVVAPGTNGQLTDSVKLTGTPEVKVGVTNKATVTLTGWTLEDGSVYCPITVTVGETPITCTGTIEEFKAAIEEAINAYHKEFDANTDLSLPTVQDQVAPAVSWEWAFNGNDENDTYLGDQAAEGNPSSIKVEIATTVTQID